MADSNSSAFGSVFDTYYALLDKRDPRVDGWFLMSSPLPTVAICATYVFIVTVAGPRFMKNREAYDLRNILVVYNFLQVLFSSWLFYEYGMGGWFGSYSFRCQPVDYSTKEMAMRMLHVCWWYYFSKFTEFFDTFFFVARKKFHQVSLLHVVHHGIMPFSVWFGAKFTPGGHSTFFALLNTFVHIVMYFYYMVSAMGPRYAHLITWKKHLTKFQMVQFVAISTHAFQLCFRDCDYPIAFVYWIGGHGVLFLGLFADFYYKAYKIKAKKRRDVARAKRAADAEERRLSGAAVTEKDSDTGVIYRNGFKNGIISERETHQILDSNCNGINLKSY